MKFPEEQYIWVPEDSWTVLQYQVETILDSHHSSVHTVLTLNKTLAPNSAFFL